MQRLCRISTTGLPVGIYMMKYSFMDDYSEGCHLNILRALNETNLTQQMAYGNDQYSYQAKKLICKYFNKDGVDIHFVSGGTLANLICISSILRPYEAIISASSGHIAWGNKSYGSR